MVKVVPYGQGATVSPNYSLNVIGFFCPVPVSEAKKALKIMLTGEVLEVWADDPETLHDMPMLTHRNSNTILSVEERAGEFRFLIEVAP